MKKLIAVLMTLLLVCSFAACGGNTEDETTTRPTEEVLKEAADTAAELVEFKAELDPQLALVNSADNNNKFFDIAGMVAAGARFDALLAELDMQDANLTDGDASIPSAATAKEAAAQAAEINEKINTAAVKYCKQFKVAFPNAELVKLYCLTVFMSGEPSNYFAVEYNDGGEENKFAYSISSFTAGTPEDVLTSVQANLFMEAPVSSRDAVKNANATVDTEAVLATAVEELAAENLISDGDADVITDGDAK